MTIASPIDGIVTASALTTVGQVVNPGAELMRIVPADTELEIEALLPNKDIGFVKTGQEAVIKIEAFPFTRYGVLHGHVTSVATDAVPEPDAQQMEDEPAKQLQSLIPFGNVQRMQNLVFPVTIRLDADVINVDGLLQPPSPGHGRNRRDQGRQAADPRISVLATCGSRLRGDAGEVDHSKGKTGTMKKHIISAAIAMAALSMPAQAQSTASKGGYEYSKNLLSDPSALNWNIEACSHGGIKPEVQEGLAKLMGVPQANVRLEFCRRILTAYAKGRIPYDDYLQFMQGGGMPASVSKALRIAGSGPKKPQGNGKGEIVLRASARMDSGETFKGSTVASNGKGRFSVQSSRKAVKCSGAYDLSDRRPTITLPVTCTDGRDGKVEVTRAPDMMSAWGKVKLSDGSAGRLTVGRD